MKWGALLSLAVVVVVEARVIARTVTIFLGRGPSFTTMVSARIKGEQTFTKDGRICLKRVLKMNRKQRVTNN